MQMKNWDPLVSRPALAIACRESASPIYSRFGRPTENTGASVLQLEVLIGKLQFG